METALLVALSLVALATLIDSTVILLTRERVANDFTVFWTAARSLTPYAPTDWPFAYPPTTLGWLKPIALLPLGTAFAIWVAGSAAAYAVALKAEVGDRWPIAFFFFPTAFSLLTGQMSMLVAAMVFTAFRTEFAGLILGLAFTIKPQLVFLAPVVFIIGRDWRQLASFFAAVWTITILALTWMGGALWIDWLQSFDHFRQRAMALDVLGGAASPAGLATWLGFNPVPWLVAGGALALVTLARCFRTSEHKGALLGLCCILASPYALTYDLVIIMPLVIADLLRPSWRSLPAFLAVTMKLQVVGTIGVAMGEVARVGRRAKRRGAPSYPVSNPNTSTAPVIVPADIRN